jgi:hypothetical protein
MPRRQSPIAGTLSPNKEYELVDARFGKDTDEAIEKWLLEMLHQYKESHRDLHQSKIPKWRKSYLGTPQDETKSFPWPNAANIVVQIVGQYTDTLTAREISYVFGTSPSWSYRYIGGFGDAKENEDKRRALESFMDSVALEPAELNLYDQYSRWSLDGNKLGTAFIKPTYEHRVEAEVTGYSEKNKAPEYTESTIYQGPKAEKVRHEDVLADPGASDIPKAKLVAVRRSLKRLELEERAALGFYDAEKVKSILASPDRPGYTQQEQEELREQGINQTQQGGITAEWDIWECWFPWFHNGTTFRLVFWVHLHTKTVLRKVFNFMPWNETGLVRYKLGYATDGMYGHGMAELQHNYQEGVSAIINQRIDNATVANTRFFRISPRLRNLDQNFEINPMGMVPAEKDEFEAMAVGDVYPSSFLNEESLLRHAMDRAGIAPAVAGMGSGTTGKTKGIYSANSTLALMQAGNTRTNHVTSTFRHAHVKLGSILTAMYGKFPGIEQKAKAFGKEGPALVQALEEFLHKKSWIPIRSSDASINREVDKQNDMLIVSLLQRHYTAVGQMMQAISNPAIPPEVKDYLMKVIHSMDAFTMRILRDFQYDQPEEYVPEPRIQPAGAPGGGANLPVPLAQPHPAPIPGAGIGPQPGIQGPNGGPQGNPPIVP